MALETYITDDIEEIGETAWNTLSAGQPFQSYNWYRFGERVMTELQSYHVILSENGQMLGRASFWRIGNDPSLASGWLLSLTKRWPFLICRTPFVTVPGWDFQSPLRADILREVVRIGHRLRREKKCSFLIFDGLDGATVRTIPHSIKYTFNMPGTIFYNNQQWKNFDQYLVCLKSSERRQIKLNLRKAQELGIVVTRHQQVTELDEAEKLYRILEARKGWERNPYVRAMLENLSMVNGTWLAARDASGQLVGCLATFEDNGAQFLTFVGLDTAQYAYFALMYEALGVGLEHDIHAFHWGADAYSFKERLGFSKLDNDSIAIAY
jgi:predicted N-acyltransferase